MPKRSKNSKATAVSIPIRSLLHTARTAALRGGELALKGFAVHRRRSGEKYKKHLELVTEYDVKIEKLIRQTIRQHFPDHQINGEEDGSTGRKNRYLWQIDPIDGTTNFTIHHPLFAVSVGLMYGGEPLLGVVYIPLTRELFWAVAGQGACQGTKRIHVSNQSNLNRSIVSFEFSHDMKFNRQTLPWFTSWKLQKIKCRSIGSAAVSACYVAAGHLEAAILSQVMPWDLAAGGLIVREAGGIYTDKEGVEKMVYDQPVIISNKLIHQGLIKKIA